MWSSCVVGAKKTNNVDSWFLTWVKCMVLIFSYSGCFQSNRGQKLSSPVCGNHWVLIHPPPPPFDHLHVFVFLVMKHKWFCTVHHPQDQTSHLTCMSLPHCSPTGHPRCPVQFWFSVWGTSCAVNICDCFPSKDYFNKLINPTTVCVLMSDFNLFAKDEKFCRTTV